MAMATKTNDDAILIKLFQTDYWSAAKHLMDAWKFPL